MDESSWSGQFQRQGGRPDQIGLGHGGSAALHGPGSLQDRVRIKQQKEERVAALSWSSKASRRITGVRVQRVLDHQVRFHPTSVGGWGGTIPIMIRGMFVRGEHKSECP